MKVAIIDYGMGNLSSVAKAFETLNAEVVVSSAIKDIESADRLVLPGVGAFGEGIKNLRASGLIGPLEEQVLQKRKPFLGICLGMQLLARNSSEHGFHNGLGWIPAVVEPFNAADAGLKAIHIGWNEAFPRKHSPLFDGLGNFPNFYFVHGYHLHCQDQRTVCAISTYGKPFASAIQQENIFGVQFHPEKSQETGLGLLKNFLRWDPARQKDLHPAESFESRAAAPKIRLVPTLLFKGGRLVKTVQFKLMDSGIRRDVGHLVKAPMVYDAQLVDELVYLDIHASLEERNIEQLRQVVAGVAGRIFMPLTVGGGIRTLEDIRRLLQGGADKVAINTAAVLNPDFIKEAANTFGNQCIVISIDAKLMDNGRYEVFTHSGSRATGLDPVGWARRAADAGAGEILLTSIDRDGTMQGYDLNLIRMVADAVKIPVIASGGVGELSDLTSGVIQGRASAVAAASLFHFRDQNPMKAKTFMMQAGIPVRWD